MRGYFGIGIEGSSKPMNAGNLFRSAQGFGASFVFTIGATFTPRAVKSDTSRAAEQLPLYAFDSADDLQLPRGCALIGVEITDRAVDLPSFRHPARAAYVLGPERGILSEALLARCKYVVRIPTSFSLNVATAGAVIMYDRLISTAKFGERPVSPGGKAVALPPHVFGEPLGSRKKVRKKR